MQRAEQKNRELSDVKARYNGTADPAKQLQAAGWDVIDSLRAGQAGPVNLLAMLGEDGERNRSGVAEEHGRYGPKRESGRHPRLSTDAVANLMANLQKTGFFKTVEI